MHNNNSSNIQKELNDIIFFSAWLEKCFVRLQNQIYQQHRPAYTTSSNYHHEHAFMVHIITDSSDHASSDLLDLSNLVQPVHSSSPFDPIPIDDLSNIKHVTDDRFDSIPSTN
jgi:hypothetical protein